MRNHIAALALLAACVGQVQWVAIAHSPGGAIRVDEDGDGFGGPWRCAEGMATCDAEALNRQPIADLDCNDHDRATHPGAPDRPGDGIDQDCDGADGVRAALSPQTPATP